MIRFSFVFMSVLQAEHYLRADAYCFVAFAVDHGFHGFQRGESDAGQHLFEHCRGLAGAELHAFPVAVCVDHVMPAVPIPEDHVPDRTFL